MMYRMQSRITWTTNMVVNRGIRGPGFPGVITSSISFWESMGLMINVADVRPEKRIPAAKRPRLPFI
jgi:hypothetical protein